jgi:nitrate reductase NapA
MDRRDFIKSATGGGLALAAMSCGDRREADKIVAEADGLNDGDLAWHKAPCRFCGTGCGVELGVADGKVRSVRGDEASPVNRGLLCVKGYHTPELLYGKDRLTTPMLRNPSGDGFKPISWDQALDLIAERYADVLKRRGPEAVAVYGSGQWGIHDGYAALKWVKGGMRSNNLEANARICMASAVMGFMTQFGSDEPMGCYEDLDVGDDFVLWGNNMAEMHPVLFSRILENKRKRAGVRIVDIGTRRTPTTDYADLYVEFIPGSDLALANGILHLLTKSGRVDRAFIEENVVFKRGIEDLETIGHGCYGEQAEKYTFKDETRASSYEEFTKLLEEYTPARVTELSGVPEAQLQLLADIYGNRDRGTVSLWCMGVNQHTRGTWMNNLLNDLHLITGKIARPGANPLSLTGQPSACGTVREVGTLSNRLPADRLVTVEEHRRFTEEVWGLPEGTIPSKPGYHTVDMFRALTRGDVEVIWIQTTNPWVSLPNLHRFDRKPNDGRFIVVSEIYPTPTTAVADLILPSAAWVEREGVFGNTERRTQQWNQIVEPPGEAKEDAWQIIEVAKRMGYGNLFPWPEDNWHEPMFEEYRKFTLGIGKDLASYAHLKASRGARWPVVDGKDTGYRYAAGRDPYVKKSKGVEFYKAKKFGYKAAAWFRPYHPPAEMPDAEFPFWMATGRVLEHWHTGSMTRRIRPLHQAVPESYVELNPDDANDLGVTSGETVRLVSRRGEMKFKCVINGRGKPPKGSVFVPFFDEAKLINRLTLDAMDSISKEPDFKKTAVRVEKVSV